ncbi:sulfate transporter family-domain-containing protein, partial [Syncephalis pseudoplumigaleata]
SIRRYLQRLLPIARWLPYYNRRWLMRDATAGLTIGVMVVPQSIAYAHLAGLPAEHGLYTALMGILAYAALGTAKDINVGPAAVLSLYIGQGVQQVVKNHTELGDAAHLVVLASMMALITGSMVALLGLLRMGILLDFISSPVVVGFTFGAGIDIMLTQLPKLLGVTGVNSNESTFDIIHALSIRLKSASLPDLGVGLSAVAMLLALKAVSGRFGARSRVARIVGSGRIAITVVFYTLVSFLVAVAGHGDDEATGRRHPLHILRRIPGGLPAPSVPAIDGALFQQLLVASMLPFLQTIIEHITIAKAISRMNGYNADPSQELVALGLSNITTAFFSGFGVSGAMSRSMMVAQMGARTPLNSIFSSIVVCGSLLFLPPAFYYIPDACLAAIIITSVFGLMRGPRTFIKLWRINPVDMFTCLVAFVFTVIFNIAIGISAAVALSIALMLYKIARPDCILLEPCIDNPDVYVDPSLPDVVTRPPPPGILVFRVEEAIIFPNAHYVRQQLLKAVQRQCASGRPPVALEDELWCNNGLVGNKVTHHRGDDKAEQRPRIRAVIMDFSAVNNIDASGLQVLLDLKSTIATYAGESAHPFEMHFVAVKKR